MKTFRGFLAIGSTFVLAAATFLAGAAIAQDTTTSSSGKSEQWIHVRVESKDDHGETVRVNVPASYPHTARSNSSRERTIPACSTKYRSNSNSRSVRW